MTYTCARTSSVEPRSWRRELWRCDFCRFCVNGSTQGNEALALSLASRGERVVVSRSLHASVLAGLVLSGLDPVWVRPDVDPTTGLALRLPPQRVGDALAAAPEASGVFLVEPNFVGMLSDLPTIAELCRTAGAPLVVDQAWGAHFGFHPRLPRHALAAGADALVTSAHKTLSAFTQGAYLLARDGRLATSRLSEAFDLLHTTSPSAAILASLDRARRVLAVDGQELLGRTLDLVDAFRERIGAVDGLVVLPTDDPTKLVLALPGTGADGLQVEADLFGAGIRVELANRDTLVPLVTIGDTEESVERLTDALLGSFERRRGESRAPGGASIVWSVAPEIAMTPRAAFFAARETVSAAAAHGRIAAETVAPYPPGIPAIAPGEVVTGPLLESLREAGASGTRLAYCADPSLDTLQVVAR